MAISRGNLVSLHNSRRAIFSKTVEFRELWIYSRLGLYKRELRLYMPQDSQNEKMLLKESSLAYAADGDIDLSLLKESLAMTPWERMQANDDALNFAESLRAGMEKRHAKSK